MAFPPDNASPPDDTVRFANRHEAGRALGAALLNFRRRPDVVVLGLPRGGVPVAFEVAEILDTPMDVFVVRKLGLPWQPELAIGAIASGGVRVLSDDVIGWLGVSEDAIAAVTEQERAELERREREYRRGRPPASLDGCVVILVDDGLATGASMRAAVQAVRAQTAKRIIVAAPVGAPETCRQLAEVADEVVCARTPAPFAAVGQWYTDFSQTTDEEVRSLMELHAARASRKERTA
jgi:putative phosphoribosyl transferase